MHEAGRWPDALARRLLDRIAGRDPAVSCAGRRALFRTRRGRSPCSSRVTGPRPPATSRAAHARPDSRPVTASPRGPLHRLCASTTGGHPAADRIGFGASKGRRHRLISWQIPRGSGCGRRCGGSREGSRSARRPPDRRCPWTIEGRDACRRASIPADQRALRGL